MHDLCVRLVAKRIDRYLVGALMVPMFAACQKFDPRYGDPWSRYIEWSGFRHINELVYTAADLNGFGLVTDLD